MSKSKQKETAEEAQVATQKSPEEAQKEWENLPNEDKIERIVQNAASKQELAQIINQLSDSMKVLATRVENVELKLKLAESNAAA
jgi:hypothetical protein